MPRASIYRLHLPASAASRDRTPVRPSMDCWRKKKSRNLRLLLKDPEGWPRILIVCVCSQMLRITKDTQVLIKNTRIKKTTLIKKTTHKEGWIVLTVIAANLFECPWRFARIWRYNGTNGQREILKAFCTCRVAVLSTFRNWILEGFLMGFLERAVSKYCNYLCNLLVNYFKLSSLGVVHPKKCMWEKFGRRIKWRRIKWTRIKWRRV